MRDWESYSVEQQQLMKQAVKDFIVLWREPTLLQDLGTKLRCTECEALCNLLSRCGERYSASILLDAHVMGDDAGDMPEHVERKAEIEDGNDEDNDEGEDEEGDTQND